MALDIHELSANDRNELLSLMSAAGMSMQAYRDGNPDVATHCPTDEASLVHFAHNGCFEGRSCDVRLVVSGLAALTRFCAAADLSHVANGVLGAALQCAVKEGGPGEALSLLGRLELHEAVPVVMIGDSHTAVYATPFMRGSRLVVPILLSCRAGSAMGLANPESKSGYGELIKRELVRVWENRYFPATPVAFKFGQVDTEFVLTFQRLRSHSLQFEFEEAMQFFERSTAAYSSFLGSVVPPSRRESAPVFSVFPPALSDEAIRKGYFNADIANREGVDSTNLDRRLREMSHANLQERTTLHKLYNALLKQKADAAGFPFVDDFSPLLGVDRLLSERFALHGGSDHHLTCSSKETVFDTILWGIVPHADV